VYQLHGRLRAVGCAFRQALHHQVRQHRWDCRAQPINGLGCLDHVRGQHGGGDPSPERRPPGQHLVRHYAQRVDVCPMVDLRIAGCLLGRHVRRGTERNAR
jgi:hypothetical protein